MNTNNNGSNNNDHNSFKRNNSSPFKPKLLLQSKVMSSNKMIWCDPIREKYVIKQMRRWYVVISSLLEVKCLLL